MSDDWLMDGGVVLAVYMSNKWALKRETAML